MHASTSQAERPVRSSRLFESSPRLSSTSSYVRLGDTETVRSPRKLRREPLDWGEGATVRSLARRDLDLGRDALALVQAVVALGDALAWRQVLQIAQELRVASFEVNRLAEGLWVIHAGR